MTRPDYASEKARVYKWAHPGIQRWVNKTPNEFREGLSYSLDLICIETGFLLISPPNLILTTTLGRKTQPANTGINNGIQTEEDPEIMGYKQRQNPEIYTREAIWGQEERRNGGRRPPGWLESHVRSVGRRRRGRDTTKVKATAEALSPLRSYPPYPHPSTVSPSLPFNTLNTSPLFSPSSCRLVPVSPNTIGFLISLGGGRGLGLPHH
ncbi:hypothetical protein Pmani_005711 [Petrolisthes manimaculis]|uniref:Uncharacterized protein n=1 Tax=Petrolisthes manimaculis TaxID=1843537 RepID=A0AAE1QBM8_9EUCA|nr:hypothetical protein Pmani_005711 [Petrolisthes manimaculis]